MRFRLIVFAALTVFGCSSSDRTPTGPSSSPPPAPSTPNSPAFVWGMVIPVGGSGACITNAKVEVVHGQRTGETMTQEPCDVWDYGGGFELKDLTPGVEMTLRASAPGYVTKDFVITPVPLPHGAIFLELSPTP